MDHENKFRLRLLLNIYNCGCLFYLWILEMCLNLSKLKTQFTVLVFV